MKLKVGQNTAGYNLSEVKTKSGFDLTPLFVGSQGTLGIVSEAVFGTEPHVPGSVLYAVFLKDTNQTQGLLTDLLKLPKSPSAIEIVDDNVLSFVNNINPNQLGDIIKPPFPRFVLLVEFDQSSSRNQKKIYKKVSKIFKKYGVEYKRETDETKKENLWKIRQSTSALISYTDSKTKIKALPIVGDGVVPRDRFAEYLEGIYQIFNKNKIKVAVWGHAGAGSLQTHPFLDIAQVGDRQKIFRIIEEYNDLVIGLGGSTSGSQGDGRLKAPFLQKLYGTEANELFTKVKNIFDPYGLLNTGVKIGVSLDDIKPILRTEYSLNNLYDHLPRL